MIFLDISNRVFGLFETVVPLIYIMRDFGSLIFWEANKFFNF